MHLVQQRGAERHYLATLLCISGLGSPRAFCSYVQDGRGCDSCCRRCRTRVQGETRERLNKLVRRLACIIAPEHKCCACLVAQQLRHWDRSFIDWL